MCSTSAAEIAASASLPARRGVQVGNATLETCDLNDNEIGDEGFAALARALREQDLIPSDPGQRSASDGW